MKKKILAFALALSLALGVAGQSTVYADVSVSDQITTAEEKQFDKDYSVTWASGTEESWNKITLENNGILQVYYTKPVHDSLGFLSVDVYVYDENGNRITMIRNDDNTADANVYVGLEKGTYYVELTPQYSNYSHDKTTNYKFSFTASTKCELESNDTKTNATTMKVDTSYTGYIGGGCSTISGYDDREDIYAIKLTKGQVYKFTFSSKANIGTTVIKLLGKNVALDTIWPSVEKDTFCVSSGDSFIAPYTGTYYVRIYNYINSQYQYTVKITNITPKATSIASLKVASKGFTVKWKKVSYASGYQVQYSTSKTFKSKKTVKVSSSKVSTTIKNLSSKKKYYVRVRAYRKVGDIYTYTSWSTVKTVTTK